MRRVAEGVVYTLLIYVDDILVIVTEAEFERLREAFTKEFHWITMEVSNILLYLGMQVELHWGYAILHREDFKRLREFGKARYSQIKNYV
jgi:hypothetical protein